MAEEIYAYVTLQEWEKDVAIPQRDITVRIDHILLEKFAAAGLRAIAEKTAGGGHLDDVAYAADIIGDGEDQHGGPFEVYLDGEELDRFFGSVGIADITSLTDEELDMAREEYHSAAIGLRP